MRYLTAAALSLLMLFSVYSFAQSAPSDEDRFFYGSEIDDDLQSVVTDKNFSTESIQYGAVITPVYLYESVKDESLSSAVINTKLWAKSYLWNNSYFYIGVRDSYMKVLSHKGESYKTAESDNTFDLDQALLSMSGYDGAINLTLGRKYFNIGTGLVLNGRGDGAEAYYAGSVLSVNLLGLYTGLLIKDNNPYGLSDKDFTDGAERVFSGGVVTAVAGNQNFYVFGLFQKDLAKKDKTDNTTYDSGYYGVGISGVFLNDFSYYAESVFESGISYIDNNTGNEKTNIAAYAVNSGLTYFIPLKFNPTLVVQYAYGSGDNYRDDYTRGNRPDTAVGYDKGFISFGTYSGGYALKPALSNIHIFRAGVTCVPFSTSEISELKKMSLGVKYSYYMKDKNSSAINDGEAPLHKSDIGDGMDVSLRWQAFYDASLYLNYGLFLPGAAYEVKDAKNFIMAGVNLSF